MKTVIIVASVLLLVYVTYRTYRFATLTDGLMHKINAGAVVLDVRTATEYNSGHISGSVNMSLGTLRERYVELDSSKTYITVCSHGLRSVKAVSLLEERGFKKVYNGGAWTDLKETVLSTRTNQRRK